MLSPKSSHASLLPLCLPREVQVLLVLPLAYHFKLFFNAEFLSLCNTVFMLHIIVSLQMHGFLNRLWKKQMAKRRVFSSKLVYLLKLDHLCLNAESIIERGISGLQVGNNQLESRLRIPGCIKSGPDACSHVVAYFELIQQVSGK